MKAENYMKAENNLSKHMYNNSKFPSSPAYGVFIS